MKTVLTVLALATMTSSCGYALAGRGSFLPASTSPVMAQAPLALKMRGLRGRKSTLAACPIAQIPCGVPCTSTFSM